MQETGPQGVVSLFFSVLLRIFALKETKLMKKVIIACAVASMSLAAVAQIPDSGRPLDLTQRMTAAYGHCRCLFEEARYAEAIMECNRFLDLYPFALQRIEAQKLLADSYYAGGQYAQALEAYSLVQTDGLSDDEAGQCCYRQGISALECDAEDQARTAFSAASRYPSVRPAALFYLGRIAYGKGEYNEAAEYFRQSGGSKAPENQSGMYLASIDLIRGDFQQAYTKASQLLGAQNLSPEVVAELNRIAGEALFRMDRSSEAAVYLKKYVDATENPEPAALYMLGVEMFAQGDCAGALGYFRTVTDRGEGALQQSAYLYAGQSLLEEGDSASALADFDKAASMNYDPAVSEAAFYNYAVVKSGEGALPFDAGAATFEEFLRRYPSGAYADRVAVYLAGGYSTRKKNEQALAKLRKVSNPSPEVNNLRQRVLYALGTDALHAGKLDKAAGYLKEAQDIRGTDAAMTRELTLASGILHNRRKDYRQAAGNLRTYLRQAPQNAANRPVALYQLAYALYGGRDARGAAEYFAQAATALRDPAGRADAYNRLGDIAAAHAEFDRAATYYRKASDANSGAADYAALNEARMKGFLRDYTGKLAALESFRRNFPSSSLMPDALLEITEAQISLGRNDDAIRTYKELISAYPRTAQGRKGYIQMAMTYLDTGRSADAEEAYRSVIQLYPESEEAAQAASILKTLYADSGRGDEYIEFISTVKNAPQVSSEEAEDLEYSSAVSALRRGKDASKMERFIDAHPSSANAAAGLGLMLQNAVADNDSKAETYASRILDLYKDSPAAVQALEYKGDAAYNGGDLPKALEYYTALAGKVSDDAAGTAARMRLMRTQRDLGLYSEAGATADAILASKAADAELKEARFTKAKCLSEAGQSDAALKLWLKLADDPQDLFGARSAVEAASELLEKGNGKRALDIAKKFVNSGSPHRYWVARGFVVLSDAYKAQGKDFEARQYLEALRDNYPGNEPDIFMMISTRLEELK